MTGMLKLSDQEFKTTIINILRASMDKVDGMQEQMGSVNSEMKILRNKKIEMLEFVDNEDIN